MYARRAVRNTNANIAFRNCLRTHAADANVYALLKRELASRFGSDREGYDRANSEFVERILQRALEV